MSALLQNPVVWFLGLIIAGFIANTIRNMVVVSRVVGEKSCKERMTANVNLANSRNDVLLSEIKALKTLVVTLIDNNRARLVSQIHEKDD